MPLLWNGKIKHLFGNNFELAKNILMSNLRKYEKDPEKLNMIDDNILDLDSAGIVERIPNLSQLLEELPSVSFLGHMPIFRLTKETA